MEAVFAAVEKGDVHRVLSLLDRPVGSIARLIGRYGVSNCSLTSRRPSLAARNAEGLGLLHVAALHGRELVVRALLERGISANDRDTNGSPSCC